MKIDLRRLIKRLSSGQGLVETALFFPVLIMIFSSLVEFGFLVNSYLSLQDSTRNAARFSSDGLYYARDGLRDCDTTRDFYRQTGCLVNQELAQERPLIELNLGNGQDDIVISAFSIDAGSGITPTVSARHPVEFGEMGWSESEDWFFGRNQNSRHTSDQIRALLDPQAPSTGFVLVEVFYSYEHKLKLPWIIAFFEDPFLIYSYALMPLVSAEPTPTPMP